MKKKSWKPFNRSKCMRISRKYAEELSFIRLIKFLNSPQAKNTPAGRAILYDAPLNPVLQKLKEKNDSVFQLIHPNNACSTCPHSNWVYSSNHLSCFCSRMNFSVWNSCIDPQDSQIFICSGREKKSVKSA